jgi:hypothetical protein
MNLLSRFVKRDKVGGLISFYGLTDWWLTEFTEEERQYICNRYHDDALTRGKITSNLPVTSFLNGLYSWFRSKQDLHIARRIFDKMDELGREHPLVRPGYYQGRHFSTYVPRVEDLKRSGRLDEAESLLIELVNATEAESKAEGCGVGPWYYEELAKIYRRRKDYAKEIAILERFAINPHARGVKPPQLLERLEKVRKLLASQ